jgi:DNA-binding MarR family transcriptional regulator
MTEPSLTLQTDQSVDILMSDSSYTTQFMEIVRQFVCLRHRLRVMLPEDVAQARARFEKLFPEEQARSATDYDLLYRVSVLLARRQEPMTMGELGQALDVPLSSATRIVDLLVENGYAQRVPDAEDRRVVRVSLTDIGQEMCRTIEGFIRKRVERLLQVFTPEEQETLVALMRKFVKAFDEEL